MKTMLMAATMSLALAPLALVHAGGRQAVKPEAATPPTPAASCPYAAQMTQRVQQMQAMHQAIARAATPEERTRLRQEQWTLMRENMQAMHGAGGMGMGGMPMRPGMGMGANGSGGPGASCTAERMAMMEMMIESMADRMGPPPR